MALGAHLRLWLRRIVPWIVAVALLGYVFHVVPFARLWEALRATGPLSVVALALAYYLYSYSADSLATWATFRWFCAPLRWWDMVAIRGATYLLAIVNYNLGQGGIIYVVGKHRGVGVARATGTVLLSMGVSFVSLLVLAGIGGTIADPHDPRLRTVRYLAYGGLVLLGLYLVVIKLRPGFLYRRAMFQPLFDAGLVGHAKAFLVRFPHIAGHIFFQWAFLRLFHVEVPLSAAATLLPVVFVIALLPVTVQGLGTQQVALMAFLSHYATGATVEAQRAQVVAFSLTVTAIFVVFSLITGLVCLRSAAGRRVAAASSQARRPDGLPAGDDDRRDDDRFAAPATGDDPSDDDHQPADVAPAARTRGGAGEEL